MSDLVDRRRRRAAGVGALSALAAALASAVWWSGTLAAPERLLANSYQSAIANADSGTVKLMPTSLADTADVKSVDAIWQANPVPATLAFHRPLKIGDRITISSRDGKPDKLQVVELQQIDGAGIGVPGVRFQLVTSRQDGLPETRLVRLLIAVDDTSARPADKTL